jgi:hypothetical protein
MVTMTLRDLVLALFDCVTTALGTSDSDVVLLAQPKDGENSEFNLPVLWEFPSAIIKAGSLKTLDLPLLGRELTVKQSWARGKHNKGVFLFEEQGAVDDGVKKRQVKYTVPLSGAAPFIARRIESSEAKLQANLSALAQKPEVTALAAEHFKSAFNLSGASRVDAFVKVMKDMAFAVTFKGVPKDGKKAKALPKPATPPPPQQRLVDVPLEETNIVQSAIKATELVLSDPEAAAHFVDLSTFMSRVPCFVDLLKQPSDALSPPSKAAKRQLIGGMHLKATEQVLARGAKHARYAAEKAAAAAEEEEEEEEGD